MCLKNNQLIKLPITHLFLLKVPVNQVTSHSFVPPTEKVIDDHFAQQMERDMLQAL